MKLPPRFKFDPSPPREKIKLVLEYHEPVDPPPERCDLCGAEAPVWHFSVMPTKICNSCKPRVRCSTWIETEKWQTSMRLATFDDVSRLLWSEAYAR